MIRTRKLRSLESYLRRVWDQVSVRFKLIISIDKLVEEFDN